MCKRGWVRNSIPLAQQKREIWEKQDQGFAISVNCYSPTILESQLVLEAHTVLQKQQHLLLTVQSQPHQAIKTLPSVVNSLIFLAVKIRSFTANELTGGMQHRILFFGCIKQWELKIKSQLIFSQHLRLMFPISQNSLLCTDFSSFYLN